MPLVAAAAAPRLVPYIAGLVGRYSPTLLLLTVLLLSVTAVSDEAANGVVAAVIDGDTLDLADGRRLQLAGILAPGPGEVFAAAARDALAVAVGQPVVFAFGPRHLDRHGRLPVQVWLATADGGRGDWLQGRLLSAGLARVATTLDSRGLAAEMLRLEAAARAARLGLWADRAYAVLSPDSAVKALNSFQIVEGRAQTAAVRRGRGYLNFAADYRTDFTLGFSPEALRLLADSGLSLSSYEGVRVRARGWLRWFNGPFIDVTHPEQIEVLE